MPGLQPIITREQLVREYMDNGKTFKQIAEEFNMSVSMLKYRAKIWGISTRNGGRQRLDVVGKRFGSLLVLEPLETNSKHPQYKCMCDCGVYVERTASQLCKGGPDASKSCWDCRNKHLSALKWQGVGEISGDYWWSVKRSARVRNLEIDITMEDAWELFLKQNRKCALTGVEILFTRSRRTGWTASLDRIDSSIGYVNGNVQWVHKVINNLKMDLSETDFIEWCTLVASHKR